VAERWDGGEPTATRPRTGVGLALLLAGLAVGGAALAWIGLALDRPGREPVPPAAWWGVVAAGLLLAWSGPWFLRPTGRRRMMWWLAVPTIALVVAAAVLIPRAG
jgi:hypothetical protein